jgi:hypothetical protein
MAPAVWYWSAGDEASAPRTMQSNAAAVNPVNGGSSAAVMSGR